ncbi:MAG: acyl-CoA dehydrogenase C-terminal domain-containing protein [Gammaproteobacteria bacterium]|nr:acyl-CoA dehydrogenase C-terminal domain-containing protein [Gammaproteobacteria bacterium]
MPAYRTPLRDMRFLLDEVYDFTAHYQRLTGVETVDRALLDGILDEVARFTEQELFPLNLSGDKQGCRLENGVVTTPRGFREAYAEFVAGGWTAVTGSPEWGGQGLPATVAMLVEELTMTTNLAWGMYPALSHGAMNALEAHGTEEQKDVYLRQLHSGAWTGTMCLTEPHCGSDVGLLRTRAEPQADGSYVINGTKIFISAGEHDLAENIVHLVLARLPDAPAGTKGISMFVVPKYLPEAGGIGARNGVTCASLEEKMGIHGNATCVLNFDAARGWLVGEENKGMRCMFTMMNAARLVVGLQGLGQAEAAYQASAAYALEREQMRSLSGPAAPDRPADPIIVHPDVRRMLLTQKALTEGCRALAYHAGMQQDLGGNGIDPEVRARSQKQIDLLTPVVKGFLTEMAMESTNHALQIFGGHGFIREHGVEQYVRDTRITLIYEGTTQIQALDLIGRKVLFDGGAGLTALIAEIEATCAEHRGDEALARYVAEVSRLAAEWGDLATDLGRRGMENPEEVGAAAVDFLMYSGYVLLAWCWLRMMAAAVRSEHAGQTFYTGKMQTGDFYFRRLLPRTGLLAATIRDGSDALLNMPAEAFTR